MQYVQRHRENQNKKIILWGQRVANRFRETHTSIGLPIISVCEKMMKKYCLYKHIAPDGRIYIGITSQLPSRRWQGGMGYKGNSYFTRAINKYGWENFFHEIISSELDEDEAKRLEIEYISKFKSNQRKFGFNISSGGESKKGTKISEWQKKRISEASRGRVVSEQTRQKLSVATKNSWNDPAKVKRMREINLGELNPQYGKRRTDEEKIIRGAKSVIKLSADGSVLSKYVSLHSASKDTNIARVSIADCCNGKAKQAGGFLWRWGMV